MDLTGIISIAGKPGLYKVIAQGKNNVIVESLQDGKRFPAYATDKISALDDISIYTLEADVPLRDVLTALAAKYNFGEGLSHKEDVINLQEVLFEILPDYDEERVYPSDIKKLFQWYNTLVSGGVIAAEVAEGEAEAAVEEAAVEEAVIVEDIEEEAETGETEEAEETEEEEEEESEAVAEVNATTDEEE